MSFSGLMSKAGEGHHPESCQRSRAQGQPDHVTSLLDAVHGSPLLSRHRPRSLEWTSWPCKGVTSAPSRSQASPHPSSPGFPRTLLLLRAFAQASTAARKSSPLLFLPPFSSRLQCHLLREGLLDPHLLVRSPVTGTIMQHIARS